MKKIAPFILIPTLIILLIIILIDNKEPINPKIVTINTNHSYLYNKNQTTIDLNIYINDNNHLLTEVETYESTIIKDSNSNKLIHLELISINYSHHETYLNEDFYSYVLKFEFPNLNNDFYIENAYLELSLYNNKTYIVKIGSFNLTYLDDAKPLNWLSIDSKKDETANLSINKIIIETDIELPAIESVYISNELLQFSYINKTLIITFNSIYYINNVPVIINTVNDTYYLNNHIYSTDYFLIEKALNNINLYELNWTNQC